MAVKVRLKDANGEILHPETEWSAIKGKNQGFVVFGYTYYNDLDNVAHYYPAIRAYEDENIMWTKYFTGTVWADIDSSDIFESLEN